MAEITVPREILDDLDLGSALTGELNYKTPYMPASVVTEAVAAHVEEAEKLLGGKYRQGYEIEIGELVQVPKRVGGMRPVIVVDLETRVMLRALTALIEPQLPPLDRSYEAKKRFEGAPLEVEGCNYVVLADGAAFYDFVDHAMLAQEIVAQTGEAEGAELLATVLREVMGRQFGLPQVLHSSNVLSEVYIDVVERRLIRDGLEAFRMIDDFRVAASTWRTANDALERLNGEMRKVGLSLNDSKSFILTREHYAQFLDEPNRRWTQINDEVEVDLRAVGYQDEEDGSEEDTEATDQGIPDETVAAAALRALEMALHPEEAEADGLQVEVNRQLAAASVVAVTRIRSPSVLLLLRDFISHEPQHTDVAARYLIALAAEQEDDVVAWVEGLLVDPGVHLSAWQSLWIFEALREVSDVSGPVAEWIKRAVDGGSPDPIRARAALTLAEKQRLDVEALTELYATVHRASRPDVVAALSVVEGRGSRALRAVERDDPVNAWIVETVQAG